MDGKKLYVVEVRYETVVYAENEAAAEDLAKRYASRDVDDAPPQMYALEVSGLNDVPLAWRESIPWGSDESDNTCREILGRTP